MTKRLVALSLSLMLGAAGLTAIAANSADAQPQAKNPVQLAQNTQTPPAAARGRGLNRSGPTEAQRTMRRGEACREIAARAAGRFAELEVRLNLTAPQTGAFNRWRDQRLAAARRMAETCAAQPAPARGGRGGNATATPPNPVERLARQQTRLERRLADIQAERPILEALYGTLNAEQRQVLARNHGFGARGGMGRGPGMHRGGRMGFGGPDRDGNMMFRRGPMGRGPGGPGDQPPPPPSQFPQ